MSDFDPILRIPLNRSRTSKLSFRPLLLECSGPIPFIVVNDDCGGKFYSRRHTRIAIGNCTFVIPSPEIHCIRMTTNLLLSFGDVQRNVPIVRRALEDTTRNAFTITVTGIHTEPGGRKRHRVLLGRIHHLCSRLSCHPRSRLLSRFFVDGCHYYVGL